MDWACMPGHCVPNPRSKDGVQHMQSSSALTGIRVPLLIHDLHAHMAGSQEAQSLVVFSHLYNHPCCT